MTIRVVIADDQELVRVGFRMILDAEDDIDVVGEAADGQMAVELARRLRPDVCLLDIRMPGLDGLQAARILAGPTAPDPVSVVIVTTFDLDEYVHAALQAGACGFVLKDAGPALLIEAVRAAARGDMLVSPSITVRLLRRYATTDTARPPNAPLSDREEDVIRAVAMGRTTPRSPPNSTCRSGRSRATSPHFRTSSTPAIGSSSPHGHGSQAVWHDSRGHGRAIVNVTFGSSDPEARRCLLVRSPRLGRGRPRAPHL